MRLGGEPARVAGREPWAECPCGCCGKPDIYDTVPGEGVCAGAAAGQRDGGGADGAGDQGGDIGDQCCDSRGGVGAAVRGGQTGAEEEQAA